MVLMHGKALVPSVDAVIGKPVQHVAFDWHSDGRTHWLRAEVHAVGGEPLLIGNRIYINSAAR